MGAFKAKLKSLAILANEPYTEHGFLTVQIYIDEIIALHNAGFYTEKQYELLIKLATMLMDDMRLYLRRNTYENV